MIIRIISLLAVLLFPLSLTAAEYVIDPQHSHIRFSGMHAGEEFEGIFQQWNGKLEFDPENLEESNFRVGIDTSTAHTGTKLYDATLLGADWFDVKQHPKAVFVTQSITHKESHHYDVKGVLSIRNIAKPVIFSFTLTPEMLASGKVDTTARLSVKRLDFDIGKDPDPKAEWVENDIALELKIVAMRK